MSTGRKTGSRSCIQTAMPHSKSTWPLVWALWALYFAVAETVAVRSRQKNAPLSSYLRSLLGTHRGTTQRTIGQVSLGAFIGWFVTHLYREASNVTYPR